MKFEEKFLEASKIVKRPFTSFNSLVCLNFMLLFTNELFAHSKQPKYSNLGYQ